jgi:hypothetical protein
LFGIGVMLACDIPAWLIIRSEIAVDTLAWRG